MVQLAPQWGAFSLVVLSVGGCTEHGKPEVESRVEAPVVAEVPERPPEPPVPPPEPEVKPEAFSCERTAYLIEEEWTGKGLSTVSMDEAREKAETEACEAAGRKSGCTADSKLMSVKGSSSSRMQIVNGERSQEFEVGVRLVRFEASASFTHQTSQGPLRACETAKQMACRDLGQTGCPRDRVVVSDPPPPAHPLAPQAGPSSQSAN
jgi:hypothetical protein